MEWVGDYDIGKIQKIFYDGRLNGGWEVWLQVELGMHLLERGQWGDFQIEREVIYPSTRSSGAVKRCDFYITYLEIAMHDETYIELKCQNVFEHDSLNKVIIRLTQDIQKQKEPSIAGDPGFCLAVVHCTPEEMERAIDYIYHEVYTVTSIFLLDWEADKIYNMTQKEQLGGLVADLGENDATFLLAVSP